MNNVKLYEELSMNAHPALKTQIYDGWILRFADGYTNRSNSINMIYGTDELPAEEKTAYCEKVYTSEGLPVVYKITPLSCKLDNILEDKGYKKVTPTNIMQRSLKDLELPYIKADINVGISREWQENYFRMSGIAGTSKELSAGAVHKNIQQKVLCASVSENSVVKACGMCVIERGYAGIYDIYTDENSRRKGFGSAVCQALLRYAGEEGAQTAYLQVVADNEPALALYNKLGFEYCYQYWYRVKK